ncbi:MAG TPA: M24 family metallopeptidase [Alphaproteobacteria bacterium]|nr:M24 family metallopeptidase [Alphaproteobacteria bacterium]
MLSSSLPLHDFLENLGSKNYILPRTNLFQCEFLNPWEEKITALTGFSGSNAWLCTKGQDVALFTDSRYTLQASQQVPSFIQVFDMREKSIASWFNTKDPIYYSPELFSVYSYKNLSRQGLLLLPEEKDYLKGLCCALNPNEKGAFFEYPLEFSGKDTNLKKEEVLRGLPLGVEGAWISSIESVCWLLNIRGRALLYTPVIYGHLLLEKTGNMTLFTSHPAPEGFARKDLKIAPWQAALETFRGYQKPLYLDVKTLPMSFYETRAQNTDVLGADCIEPLKAIKNDTELMQAKKVHERDGKALSSFINWVKKEAIKGDLDEITCAKKLYDLRSQQDGFICLSFETISAFGENGAIVHYQPTEKTNQMLREGGLYLIDSGGQYFGGTTDVTRTICIGHPSKEQQELYTRVLKGHIAIASCRFPKGTKGSQLDVLARYHLWQVGLDYGHGTGHGVGNCLGVHEGPQGISRLSDVSLLPGMILSNEPGYYKTGFFGIRLENLIYVKEDSDGFLYFENLTHAPFDKDLILSDLLSDNEKKWLKNYDEKLNSIFNDRS